MSNKYFVIAGNRSEYMEFVTKKVNECVKSGQFISYTDFVYVDGVESLKGYSNPKGWFVGSWREKKGINEIIVQLYFAKSQYVLNPEFEKILIEWRNKGRI